MRASILFGLAGTIAFTSALILPAELPNGVFIGTTNSTGATVLEVLTNEVEISTIASRAPNSAKLSKRIPWSSRGCTIATFSSANSAATGDRLDTWCNDGNKVPGHSLVIVSHNGVVWYLCNYSGNQQGCSNTERWEADIAMDGGCTDGKGAWLHISSWGKTYGRDGHGASICSNL